MSYYSDNKLPKDPNHVWNKIINMVPAKSKVLDIGSSSGRLGEALIKAKDCVVDGIELDEKDAAIASKILRRVWVFDIQDPANITKIKDTYDIIIFADVLEHLVDPVQVLKTIKPLLNSAGKIVFSVPNMAHISVRLALLGGDFRHTNTGVLDKTHLHFYDRKEVERIFEEANTKLYKLDRSDYPYPKKLIQERLLSLGITSTPKLLKTLEDPTATAFEYVGEAGFSNKNSSDKSPVQATQAIENDVFKMAGMLEGVQLELNKQTADNQELNNKLAAAQAEINNIKNSKSYRLARNLSKVRHGFVDNDQKQSNKAEKSSK